MASHRHTQRPVHRLAGAFGALLLAISAVEARAAPSYAFESAYSTADGEIQYVVLVETQGANGQDALTGQVITSTHAGAARTLRLDHDLASAATARAHVLIATSAFAALNLVTPDYVMPSRFVPTDGGALDYAGSDVWNLPPVPVDGTNAQRRDGTFAQNAATNFAGRTASVPILPITVVEYYHAAFDHYFISGLAPDIDALDSGRTAGWARTGQAFAAWPAAGNGSGAALSPVCRFYIPPEHGDSHFLSALPAECADVLAKTTTDPNYSGYVYESPGVFTIALPDLSTGACPASTTPVYRLWNTRGDSNHRYTVDPLIKQQMIARGYVAEGYGPSAVAMCASLAPTTTTEVRVTGPTPFALGCDGVAASGILYANSEVEPWVTIDPRDPTHLIGVWQQDRWSNGGARGLLTGVSFDAGRTWTRSMAAFSRCTGGTAANGGNYTRASDPWVTIGPDGTAYQISLSFTGNTFAAGSASAVLASRSVDGGRTWSNPATLIRDGQAFFNDKESITADSTDARFVYATWDRLDTNGRGPTNVARSQNSGQSWDTPIVAYDPGQDSQTINNQIVVLPNGTLVDFFTRLDGTTPENTTATLALIHSSDKGATWSAPVMISAAQSLGTMDPDTGRPLRDATNLGAIAVGPRGELAVTWQDARFSGGVRDGIALARSQDGGLTWSTPVGLTDPAVQAFLPAIAYLADGTLGVTYYDMRGNTGDPSTLPVDLWLISSHDGATWSERHLAGPFDLAIAPIADGLFLGDYQGLVSNGTLFLPFYARTNTGDLGNRTDIYFAEAGASAGAKSATQDEIKSNRSVTAPTFTASPDFARRQSASITRMMQRRIPGWTIRGIVAPASSSPSTP